MTADGDIRFPDGIAFAPEADRVFVSHEARLGSVWKSTPDP